MSWQLASYLILTAVLVAGFAWYERSRPPSQVVALVAALVALAVAGRLAFAALPNVKPTTDIAIFAGYALGAAPGFAVGALAGLVSNFWFGQGPWTPWQMAAWGLCGALGAALALRGRPPGRLTLAVAGALAGVGFGALLNFYEMTYGGGLSLQRFLALESRAFPFDAAHAIGNATLALIAGPAMVRMLVRFRRRFEWRMRGAASGALALLAALALALPAHARADTATAAAWLASAQNSDGGWGASPSSASDPAMTGWAMLGLEAAGRNPLDVSRNGSTPVDYLRAHLGDLNSSGDYARTILALEGAGVNPSAFGGHNLVATLLRRRRPDGSFEEWPSTTAFAVLALRRAGTAGLDTSLSWLARVQNSDGGWGDVEGSPSTPDETGAVMEAMPHSEAARRGLAYLRAVQRPSGGFALSEGGSANSQSTAWAVQGMVAVGAAPGSVSSGGKSGVDYLESRQAGDGHYRYSASSDQTPVWVTAEALPAVSGKAFPVAPPPREPKQAITPTPKPVPGHNPSGLSRNPTGLAPKAPAALPSLPGLPRGPSGSLPSIPKALPGVGGASSGHPSAPLPPGIGAGAGILPQGGVGSGSTLPGGSVPIEGPTTPAAPAAVQFTAGPKSGPKPWTPLGIGIGSGGLALCCVVLLGRRRGW